MNNIKSLFYNKGYKNSIAASEVNKYLCQENSLFPSKIYKNV